MVKTRLPKTRPRPARSSKQPKDRPPSSPASTPKPSARDGAGRRKQFPMTLSDKEKAMAEILRRHYVADTITAAIRGALVREYQRLTKEQVQAYRSMEDAEP